MPSDVEQFHVSLVTEFEIRTEQSFFFQTLPSTIVFKLKYALFFLSILRKYIFDQEMFCSAPTCICDVLTSCMRSSYIPSGIRWKYPGRVKITENLVGYAKDLR